MNKNEFNAYIKKMSYGDLRSLKKSTNKKKYPKRYKMIKKQLKAYTEKESNEVKKIEYATFLQRLLAQIIDTLIYTGIFFFIGISISLIFKGNRMILSLSILFGTFFITIIYLLLYQIYCHKRWGATPGKMIAKIKVVHLDGTSLSWLSSFNRSSVDIILFLLNYLGIFLALSQLGQNELLVYTYLELLGAIQMRLPELSKWIPIVTDVWVWSEVFVMLTNKKKRALQDFIAETIVIKNISHN